MDAESHWYLPSTYLGAATNGLDSLSLSPLAISPRMTPLQRTLRPRNAAIVRV